MSVVSLLDVKVLNNHTPFTAANEFEITFECLVQLREGLEWKLTYVGSATSAEHDQELDSLLVGPIPIDPTLPTYPACLHPYVLGLAHLRFMATRIGHLMQRHLKQPDHQDIVLKLQILRYINPLVEIHKYVSHLSCQQCIAPPEQWPPGTTSESALSTAFKRKLMAQYFPTHTASTFNKTLLTATILALMLHIPPPTFMPSLVGLEHGRWTGHWKASVWICSHLDLRDLACSEQPLTSSQMSHGD
ncbi:hypothetical protein AYL99_11948 [Fonsecaea erecta]|uniref:Anti-silencing function protein 1 n=1 Tax=Fonsecaea erecta TaxID=1367422 RepID=A0A178Z3B5_9EURO|nr:hypothetical protein AYL99_11948 [Fonsecaea erecta]OAP53926.1 hypothetical protein AYL99_11948 [Fonsecaea erecta]